MKNSIHMKHVVVCLCVVCLSFSAIAVAHMNDDENNVPLKEIWLKLWEKNGKVVDIQFHIRSRGAYRQDTTSAGAMSVYPFQFDISDLGDISAEDVKGLVYGYNIASENRPESPLTIRWWTVKRDSLDSGDPTPAKYPLTLKLRVWDADGIEYNPERQLATLSYRSGVLGEPCIVQEKLSAGGLHLAKN